MMKYDGSPSIMSEEDCGKLGRLFECRCIHPIASAPELRQSLVV